jgi:hypothetical protein
VKKQRSEEEVEVNSNVKEGNEHEEFGHQYFGSSSISTVGIGR